MDKFTYLGSSVSSTKNDINIRLAKAWTTIDWLSVIWKSDLTNKIKHSFFFQAAVMLILLYGCTTWTLTKHGEKAWWQLHKNAEQYWTSPGGNAPTKKQLYNHLPPITKTIQVRQTSHAGHCWRSKNELISDILPWTPSHGRAKAERPGRTYIQQLCADTGYIALKTSQEQWTIDGWQESVRESCAGSATWWFLKQTLYILIYKI